MPAHIVRFRATAGAPFCWGLVRGGAVAALRIADHLTTGELIERHRAALVGDPAPLVDAADALPVDEVELTSPVTDPRRVICQGANYRQHMIDSGMDPDAKRYNMFFNKSTASVSGPREAVVVPAHVSLLDYEVELALVIGAAVRGPIDVTDRNLDQLVAGVCVANDYSARDVQLREMQFFKGKSYRSFCPVGPVLCLLGPADMGYLSRLRLTLRVNGEIRQDDTTANLVHGPVETLAELSQFSDLDPGDLVLTGTPSGCALSVPPPAVVKLANLLPDALRWRLFLRSQLRSPRYLRPGDTVEASIASADGVIDLGWQRNAVVAGAPAR